LREQLETTLEYFGNNVHRMEYPEYQAEGWHIGSGVVESACKTVVGQRLKGAGMRWGAGGAHALCHVRALYRSEKGQWQAFWRRLARGVCVIREMQPQPQAGPRVNASHGRETRHGQTARAAGSTC